MRRRTALELCQIQAYASLRRDVIVQMVVCKQHSCSVMQSQSPQRGNEHQAMDLVPMYVCSAQCVCISYVDIRGSSLLNKNDGEASTRALEADVVCSRPWALTLWDK